MSDLDNAINSINASAAKAENTATFLDDMSTFDDQSSVTNPNNGQTVASIPKQIKDRTDVLFAAAESDINQAVADAEQSATDAQDAADSIGRYQGLWPDTGGIADKGDTYQTQVSGAPTGQYFTALQDTTIYPVGDDVNWRAVVSFSSISGANLLSNHNFLIQTPDDSQPLPSATPTSYPPGHQIFSGVFANETSGITNLTYIDGRVSFSGGDLYFAVPNTGAIARLTSDQLAASVADFDGKPRTRGVSFALVGNEYRVTVGADALEDADAVLTPLGSVKLEQGSMATGHEVGANAKELANAGDSRLASGKIYPVDGSLITLGTQSTSIPAGVTRLNVDTGNLVDGETLYLWEPSGDFGGSTRTITNIVQNLTGGYTVTADAVEYEFIPSIRHAARGVYDPFGWGADVTGASDVRVQMQAWADALPSVGGADCYFSSGTYKLDGSGESPTVQNPLRAALITKNNIKLHCGGCRFNMVGITAAYLDSIQDIAASGRDVFTFFTFMRVGGCRINGGRFTGTWDGTGVRAFSAPRAKGIGFFGGNVATLSHGYNIVDGCHGDHLLGNLVNFTPSYSDPDGAYESGRGLLVINTTTETNYENGVNFHGDTFDAIQSNNHGNRNNGNGFEGATIRLYHTGNTYKGNKGNGYGLSSRQYYSSGNTCDGNGNSSIPTANAAGIALSETPSDLEAEGVISGDILINNGIHGVEVYPNYRGVQLKGLYCRNNNTFDSSFGSDIYLGGTPSEPVRNINITGCTLLDQRSTRKTKYGVILNTCYNTKVVGSNIMAGHKNQSVLAQNSCIDALVGGNILDNDVSISVDSINSWKFDNYGDGPRKLYGTTLPSGGNIDVGDRFEISQPSIGQVAEYVCTSTGPIVWKALYTVQA